MCLQKVIATVWTKLSLSKHLNVNSLESRYDYHILTNAITSLYLLWFGFQVSVGHDSTFFLLCYLLHKNEKQRLRQVYLQKTGYSIFGLEKESG